jgi:hypothetical protein
MYKNSLVPQSDLVSKSAIAIWVNKGCAILFRDNQCLFVLLLMEKGVKWNRKSCLIITNWSYSLDLTKFELFNELFQQY